LSAAGGAQLDAFDVHPHRRHRAHLGRSSTTGDGSAARWHLGQQQRGEAVRAPVTGHPAAARGRASG